MKATLLLLLLLQVPHRYDALQIVHEEHKLNSGGRMADVSRALIKMVVPAHCDYLTYEVNATPRNPLQDLGLLIHIRDKLKFGGITGSISSGVLTDITQPSADGVTDALVFADSAAARLYSLKMPSAPCIEDYSRRHVANALVGIPIKYSATPTVLYLVIRNPTAFEAEYVTIEAVALHRK